MTEPQGRKKLLATVKAPLIFSAILGLIAGVVTTIAASGGTGPVVSTGMHREVRLDLGLIAFGIAFIACLVMCAMLSLSFKENPDHLSEGSGVSRKSEDRLKAREEKQAEQDSDSEAEYKPKAANQEPENPEG